MKVYSRSYLADTQIHALYVRQSCRTYISRLTVYEIVFNTNFVYHSCWLISCSHHSELDFPGGPATPGGGSEEDSAPGGRGGFAQRGPPGHQSRRRLWLPIPGQGPGGTLRRGSRIPWQHRHWKVSKVL